MNDTKWQELCEAMRSFPDFIPFFRVKDILAQEPADWDGEWYYHPLPYYSIEWLDIDSRHVTLRGPDQARPDRTDEIIAELRRFQIPFSREGCYLRVWGYVTPGAPPRGES
jgi:hypothetical protein